MTDLLHSPGFLGTNANFAADMTLVMSILVALIFTTGYWLALKGKYDIHKWVQTTGAVLNVILVFWLMLLPYRDFIVRDSGGPRDSVFYYVTTIHATVGFFAFVFGNFVVLRGHKLVPEKLRFNKYKPYMRTAYALYITTTLLGVWTYWTWFVTVSNPPVF
ncbi:MAG: hypothetical protein EPO32_02445 [Anaerolineae bacterium]|nr:MAG: hypothetical protein EPO32_02445 [Anaerolineae bacterium]